MFSLWLLWTSGESSQLREPLHNVISKKVSIPKAILFLEQRSRRHNPHDQSIKPRYRCRRQNSRSYHLLLSFSRYHQQSSMRKSRLSNPPPVNLTCRMLSLFRSPNWRACWSLRPQSLLSRYATTTASDYFQPASLPSSAGAADMGNTSLLQCTL